MRMVVFGEGGHARVILGSLVATEAYAFVGLRDLVRATADPFSQGIVSSATTIFCKAGEVEL